MSHQNEPPHDAPHHDESWLERLSRESWQLELLISGFVLFLLAGSYDGLQYLENRAEYIGDNIAGGGVFQIPVLMIEGAWLLLFLNLLLHVVLRGMWIAAIGLRSVSGDIEFDKLRFEPIFTAYLQRRMGSFDNFINRLERLSSTFFAFTFLVVFALIGLLMTLFVFMLVTLSLLLVAERYFVMSAELVVGVVIMILGIPYLICALAYGIDFATLGYFKRQRDIHRVYMPIYRFFSFITFARLYRPLYYNMIDNRFGRKLGKILVPYLLLLVLISLGRWHTHRYVPILRSDDTYLQRGIYDDRREPGQLVGNASIPSRTVDDGFLEVFVQYVARRDEPVMEELDPELRSTKWKGFIFLPYGGDRDPQDHSPSDSMLLSFSRVVRLSVNDSLYGTPRGAKFYRHPNFDERGILTTLDVDWLPRGLHELRVEKLRQEKRFRRSDTLVWKLMQTIPFVLDKPAAPEVEPSNANASVGSDRTE